MVMAEMAARFVTNQQWQILVEEARRAQASAYAPYSTYRVGAAGLTEDGSIVTGCNVENAAYLALHAEWNMVGAATLARSRLVAMVCVVGKPGVPAAPCGICRQVLYEHAGPNLQILTSSGPVRLAALFPGAFGQETVAKDAGLD